MLKWFSNENSEFKNNTDIFVVLCLLTFRPIAKIHILDKLNTGYQVLMGSQYQVDEHVSVCVMCRTRELHRFGHTPLLRRPSFPFRRPNNTTLNPSLWARVYTVEAGRDICSGTRAVQRTRRVRARFSIVHFQSTALAFSHRPATYMKSHYMRIPLNSTNYEFACAAAACHSCVQWALSTPLPQLAFTMLSHALSCILYQRNAARSMCVCVRVWATRACVFK